MIKSHKKIDEKIEFLPQRTGIYKIESDGNSRMESIIT